MSEEIKNKDTVMPTLTLEPELELEPEIPTPEQETSLMEPEPGMDPVQQEMAKMVLTPEEQEMVNSFSEKINVENAAQILQYGAGTQKKRRIFRMKH